MEYTFKGEPVTKREPKENSPICTPSGSPLASSLSLAAVCEDACYNRNSYNGKCLKRSRSLSEPSHKHENSVSGGEHVEMNDVRSKPFLNSNKTNNNDKKQPNNVTTSAVVTMPDFETVTVPNNIHDTGSRKYDNCNDRSPSHTAI